MFNDNSHSLIYNLLSIIFSIAIITYLFLYSLAHKNRLILFLSLIFLLLNVVYLLFGINLVKIDVPEFIIISSFAFFPGFIGLNAIIGNYRVLSALMIIISSMLLVVNIYKEKCKKFL